MWKMAHAAAITFFITGVFSFMAIAIIGKMSDNAKRQDKGNFFVSHSCLEKYTVHLTDDPVTTIMDVYVIEILSIVFIGMLSWISFTKFVTDKSISSSSQASPDSRSNRMMSYMNLMWAMGAVVVIGLMIMFGMNSILSDYSQPYKGFDNSLGNITNYTAFGLTESDNASLSMSSFDEGDKHIEGYSFYIVFAVLVSASVCLESAARLNIIIKGRNQASSAVSKKGMAHNVFKYIFLLGTTVLAIMILAQSYHAEFIDYRTVDKPTPNQPSLSNLTMSNPTLIVTHPDTNKPEEWKFYSNACHTVRDDVSVINSVVDVSIWLIVIAAALSLVCNMIPDIHRMIRGQPKQGSSPTLAEVTRDTTMFTIADAVAATADFIFNVFGVLFVVLVVYPFTYLNCPPYNLLLKDNRYYVTFSIVFTFLVFARMAFLMIGQWR